MKLSCLQCGHNFEGTLSKDELGWHSCCPKCGASFDADLPDSMAYSDLRKIFCTYEREHPKETPLTGYVLITQNSFTEAYSENERTYRFSSRSKAYMPNMCGYSIYANSVDGSDLGVRLEQYLAAERGGEDGWQIEKCWIEWS